MTRALIKSTVFLNIALFVLIAAAGGSTPVLAQTGRYTNDQYRISFEPPAGWVEDRNIGSDVLVQYLGPRRSDGTRPALNLIVQDSLISLSDEGIRELETELLTDLREQGLEAVQINERHRVRVAGLDALQIDLTYRLGSIPSRLVQVYVPVENHKRTYLLTFIDVVDHFDESAPSALKAIETFSPDLTRPAGSAAGASAVGTAASPSAAGHFTLLVVMIGLLAVGVIIAAIFLLFERRSGPSSENVGPN